MIRMTHPDSALVVEATPGSEALYASQGWLAVTDETTPEPTPEPVADEPAKPTRTTK